MTLVISTKGLSQLRSYFRDMPDISAQAARIAVNDTVDLAKRLSSKEIRQEINVKPAYLQENLTVTRRATDSNAEAILTGEDRATSLVRFTQGTPSFGKGRSRKIRVKVKPNGGGKEVPGAFFIKLKKGKTFDSENANVGLAVRLKPGERIRNKRQMVSFGGGLYLLYGPSVAQVFDDVAVEIEPILSENLATEFIRQFRRISNGR